MSIDASLDIDARVGIDDVVGKFAESVDRHPHDITVAQIQAAARTDTGWGSGSDDVAGLERDDRAGRRHQLVDRADHVGGGLVLLKLVIDPQPEPKVLRVGYVERRRDPRAERK